MNTFQPDLIIEVTGACNRACAGCYAPNVVAKDAASIYETHPELFLKTQSLSNALSEITAPVSIASVRGGEPTLHPEIATLLKMIATRTEQVFLETHGRWLIEEDFIPYMGLLEAITQNGVIVKISFDKMHGLKPDELQRIIHFLNWHDVEYRIAITEVNLAECMATSSLCHFVEDEKIIFQQKAKSESELVKPFIGTINVRGEIKGTLTHKFEMEQAIGVVL